MALPSWSNAIKNVLVIQPPSAATERTFLIAFDQEGKAIAVNYDLQDNSLKNYIEASVMLQYNHNYKAISLYNVCMHNNNYNIYYVSVHIICVLTVEHIRLV